MLTSDQLLAALDNYRADEPLAPSGFDEIEAFTGGMVPGRVWIVTGAHGQGKTTLLTQLAAAVARADANVDLVMPRERPAYVAARLVALTGLVPLTLLLDQTRRERHDAQRERARRTVAALPIRAYAGQGDCYVPEVHPLREPPSHAVFVDDVERVAGMTPERLAGYARAGTFVAASASREDVLHEFELGTVVSPTWARVADLVLEVRGSALLGDLRPGEGEFEIRYNRWGPSQRVVHVVQQAHYARFVQPAPADSD